MSEHYLKASPSASPRFVDLDEHWAERKSVAQNLQKQLINAHNNANECLSERKYMGRF
jgi:hypothetical protein